MLEDYEKKIQKLHDLESKWKKITALWKKKKDKKLDATIHPLHEKYTKNIDCLKCANCCKTTSPIFREVDIKRIAKFLKLSERNFISEYLREDDENDWVLKSSPCSFLDKDNTCRIYEHRPLACREYPHTNRKNMYQISDLTYRNGLMCPIVANIALELIDENS